MAVTGTVVDLSTSPQAGPNEIHRDLGSQPHVLDPHFLDPRFLNPFTTLGHDVLQLRGDPDGWVCGAPATEVRAFQRPI